MDTMLSRALREFTSGLLNQLLVNLAGPEGDLWYENLKRFLRKEPVVWDKVRDVVKAAFAHFGPVTYAQSDPVHVSTCFKSRGKVKIWRDSGLDQLGQRPAHEGGQYHCHTLRVPMQYRDMARRITDLGEDVTDLELQKALINQGHCIEVAQIDQKITAFEAGEKNTGLVIEGYATFHFVDNGGGSVSVVCVNWHSYYRGWHVYHFRFDRDNLWYAGRRVVSRKETLNL